MRATTNRNKQIMQNRKSDLEQLNPKKITTMQSPEILLTDQRLITNENDDPGDKEILSQNFYKHNESEHSEKPETSRPLRLFVEANTAENEMTFDSLAETVESQVVMPRKFETSLRRANCCSRLTFYYASTLVESVKLNKGKIADVMIEEMDSDPTRDEKLLSHFTNKLRTNKERWERNHPERAPSPEWYNFTKSAILSTIGCQFVGTAFCALVAEASTLVSIVMIRYLAQYLAKPENDSEEAVILVAIFSASAILGSLVRNFFFFNGQSMALEARKVLIQAIFDKIGRLSIRSLTETNSGKLIKLATSDVFNVEKHLSMTPYCLASPFIHFACYALIWHMTGWLPTLLVFLFWVLVIITMGCTVQATKKTQNGQAQLNNVRVQLISEMILGVQTIKAYAQENFYAKRVNEARKLHENTVFRLNILNNLGFTLFQNLGLVAILIVLYARWKQEMALEIGDSFALLALTYYLFFSVNSMTMFAFTNAGKFFETIARVSEILGMQEIEQRTDLTIKADCPAVKITDGEYSWGFQFSSKQSQAKQRSRSKLDLETTQKVILKDINVTLMAKDNLAIVGQTGAGKTSFLYSLMGETMKKAGGHEVHGRIALVDQETFIFPGSVRDNICFGLDFAECRFRKAVEAVSLENEFPAGWATVIGERGEELTPSQRVRIGLARALYQDADIYLLDEPFALLEPSISIKVFKDVVLSKLARKCVVLVTNQAEYLHKSKQILVLREGSQAMYGNFEELKHQGFKMEEIQQSNEQKSQTVAFAKANQYKATREQQQLQLIRQMYSGKKGRDFMVGPKIQVGGSSDKKEEQDEAELAEQRRKQRIRDKNIRFLRKQTFLLAQEEQAQNVKESQKSYHQESTYHSARRQRTDVCLLKQKPDEEGIKWKDFRYFFSYSYGKCGFLFLLITCIATAALQIAPSIWLVQWVSSDPEEQQQQSYPIVFAVLIGVFLLLTFVRMLAIIRVILTSSTSIHDEMTRRLLHVNIPFFDQNPIGQIIGRFSSDLVVFDLIMPLLWIITIQGIFRTLAVVITIAVVNPWSIIVIGVFAALLYFTVKLGTRVLIESSRLDAYARSPVSDSVALATDGLISMRVARKFNFFKKRFSNQLKFSTNATFCYVVANRWMSMRLDLICATFTCFVAFFLVALKNSVDSGLLIMSLQVAIDVIFLFSLTFRMYGEIEGNLSSVQRMLAYTKLEGESELVKASDKDLERRMWPHEGKIEFEEATLRYSSDFEPSLTNMTFKVQPGMLVGIVGKQGSGKSSVYQTLLRLIELQSGKTTIDGVDIKTVGLHLLRKSVGYIPQSPFLVKGTIKENLDPFNESTEAQIDAVLREIKMYDKIYSLEANLNTCVSESNNLFSVGQKQLLCLARAIITKVKVLVIEEATDGIDLETDRVIHQTLRERFKNTTVFFIAHRLTSIIDADRVLVLKEGKVQEYSHPYKLFVEHEGDSTITNIKGQFARMAIATGIENAHTLFELVEQSYKQNNRFYEPLKNSLTVTDNRTGKAYELEIINNAIAATQLLQIKNVSGSVTRSYDPAYMNTVNCISRISYIDGEKGVLEYRGYPIDQLAQRSNFTETAFLLVYGQLPSRPQLLSFESSIRNNYKLNQKLSGFLDVYRREELSMSHPMGILQTLVACLSSCHPEANPAYTQGQSCYNTQEERDVHIHRIIGQMPAIAAACLRVYEGKPLIEANINLGYVQNFLHMALGPESELTKSRRIAQALETLFILHAEHELNCSTAAVRHMTSSMADVYTSLSGAVTALYGPRHGGANEAVLRMLEEIGTVDKVPAFIKQVKSKSRVLMGFGHRVYKNYDPRASIVKKLAQEVFEITGKQGLIDVALELERVALTDQYFISKKLYPNIDFYSGLIYQSMGFPTEFFTVLFAVARFTGWISHWNEFIQDPDNKIVRPRQIYRGERQRNYVPIKHRDESSLAKYQLNGAGNMFIRLPTILSNEQSVYTEGSFDQPNRRLLMSGSFQRSNRAVVKNSTSMSEELDKSERITNEDPSHISPASRPEKSHSRQSSRGSKDQFGGSRMNPRKRPSSKFALIQSEANIVDVDSTLSNQIEEGVPSSDRQMQEMVVVIEDQQNHSQFQMGTIPPSSLNNTFKSKISMLPKIHGMNSESSLCSIPDEVSENNNKI